MRTLHGWHSDERIPVNRLCRVDAGAGGVLRARHAGVACPGHRRQRRLHHLCGGGWPAAGVAAARVAVAIERLAAVRGPLRGHCIAAHFAAEPVACCAVAMPVPLTGIVATCRRAHRTALDEIEYRIPRFSILRTAPLPTPYAGTHPSAIRGSVLPNMVAMRTSSSCTCAP